MIDIHTHILPAVDDGSESIEMTLSLLLRAYDQGIRTFFATPHSRAFYPDPTSTLDAFRNLKMAVKQYFPDVSLYLGCEVKCELPKWTIS